jgi:nucleoside-diphosphate-sugar epimerase
VIHTAFVHDFSKLPAAVETDLHAIEAIGAELAGSNRPFVVTSATAHLPQGRVGTEADAPALDAVARHRIASEHKTLSLAARGVRSSLLRLPPSVHGDGDHSFVPALIGVARAKGVSGYIGAGLNRWAAVHCLDVARLFRLALEKGAAGSRYHGVADEGVPIKDIATLIGQRLDLPVVSKSAAEAGEHFGWLAHFLSVDCPTSSVRTREQLGWQPTHPSLIADLEHGSYFDGPDQ